MDDHEKQTTLEHDPHEPAPAERRSGSRSTNIFVIAVALAWIGLLYFDGWSAFNWVQIGLGFLTASAIWGWCWEHIPRNKPYKDI